ncbi:MAG TPA: sulfotransferase domain-containing protein [Verrucomicrobiae bacterium]|nr:sulfotransferase domain-containing protein [Verrucomicrobiae bacterium]
MNWPFGSQDEQRKIDFIIIGTQKGGTTALDAYLRQHPEIGMSDIKEVHFFCTEKFFRFGRKPYALYHEHFKHVLDRKVLGEATPLYMYWKPAPKRIWEYNPQIKLIAVLRNPVERAYSAWNMVKQLNAETRPFGEAIRQELANGVEALPAKKGCGYVHRGFYAEQLGRIWNYFPREQTLIFKSEDLKHRHVETLNRLCDFIGVSHMPGVEHRETQARTYEEPIRAEDKKLLREVFEPEIKKVEKLLNWDCSRWLAD